MNDKPQGIAIVTGAASGMGEATARLMKEAGWALLLCDVNADRLKARADELGAEAHAGDITDPAFGQGLVAATGGQPIGALVHCAGLSPTMADVARILEVNLAATIRLVDAVEGAMADHGAMVLFASTAAHMIGSTLDDQINAVTKAEDVASLVPLAQESGTGYSVSKRGVYLLAQRIAPRLGKRGIRITTISPGIIDTPMGLQEMETHPIMQKLVETSSLRRSAQAEEVASVAVFLCSPAASFISGTDILVDGGSMAVVVGAAKQ